MKIGAALKRKIGPLPAWAWLGTFAVGVLVYRHFRKSDSAAAAADQSAGAASGADLGAPLQPLDSSGGIPLADTSGVGTPTIIDPQGSAPLPDAGIAREIKDWIAQDLAASTPPGADTTTPPPHVPTPAEIAAGLGASDKPRPTLIQRAFGKSKAKAEAQQTATAKAIWHNRSTRGRVLPRARNYFQHTTSAPKRDVAHALYAQAQKAQPHAATSKPSQAVVSPPRPTSRSAVASVFGTVLRQRSSASGQPTRSPQ